MKCSQNLKHSMYVNYINAKQSPATNNNALIGRPWIAKVSWAVRHQRCKMVDLRELWASESSKVVIVNLMDIGRAKQTYLYEVNYLIDWIGVVETNPPWEVPKEEDVKSKVQETMKIKHNWPGSTGTDNKWMKFRSKFVCKMPYKLMKLYHINLTDWGCKNKTYRTLF